MTFTYDLTTGHLQATFDTNNFQDVIKHITYLDKVFRETECGFCKSPNIRLRVRETTEGYLYYEYICQNPDCRAKLQVHEQQNAAHTMYLKKMEDGQMLPNGGWKKWEGRAAAEPRDSGPEPQDADVPQGGRRAAR